MIDYGMMSNIAVSTYIWFNSYFGFWTVKETFLSHGGFGKIFSCCDGQLDKDPESQVE